MLESQNKKISKLKLTLLAGFLLFLVGSVPSVASAQSSSHRYWRVLVDDINNTWQYINLSEAQFRATSGGSDLTSGGSAIVSGSIGGSPANLYDDDTGTLWASNPGGDGNVWFGYDFGVGNENNITEIAITTGDSDTTPQDFSIQYSDDNSSWTTVWSVTGETSWTNGETRVFTAPSPNSTPTITSATDSPDPVTVGNTITFSVDWNDTDGDGVKTYICKTNVVTAGSGCDGSTWASEAGSFSATDPQEPTYVAMVGDEGANNYYAFVCDENGGCSSSTSGTFSVEERVSALDTVLEIRGAVFSGGIEFR